MRALCAPLAVIMLTAMIGVHLPYGFSSVKLRAVTVHGAEFGPTGYELNLLYLAALLVLAVAPIELLSVDGWLDKRKTRLHASERHPSMRPTYRIVPATEQDLPFLPVIELAAAKLLIGHAPESALSETTSIRHFRQALAGGRLWVAVTGHIPVGFVHVELLPSGAPHLEEIDVHPSHGRQGLGRQLVATACDWVARQGHAAITLTTFRDVPFNMSFYARCGFHEVPGAELTPELAAIVKSEAERGLEAERRVVMRWSSGG